MILVLATQNPHKIEEIQRLAPPSLRFISLLDIQCVEELPESSPSIEGNARQKAEYVWTYYERDCLAEDTGLEVDALGGAPGVLTARFAGNEKNQEANMLKLLEALSGQENRKARFRTVIALYAQGTCYLFEGIAEGQIATEARGEGGFGYDPIFIPDGYDKTFAELSSAEKDKLSHRGKALSAFLSFMDKHLH